MDQSKLVVLGTLGLATVGIYCAVVLSGRFSAAGPSPNKSDSLGRSAPAATIPALSKKSEAQDVEDGIDDGDGGGGGGGGSAKPGKEAAGVATGKETGNAAAAAASGGANGVAKEPPREAASPGAAAAAAAGKAGAEGATKEAREALVARFNNAHSKARKFFKGQRFALAAEQYGIALKLCDELPNHESKRTALHNNRGAAYEKDGQYALALADCSMCLSRDAGHEFARVRKSRVLEALGREEDALSEVCAHLLLERDRVQAKAALTPSEPLTPPPPPANLEGLLQKVALKKAEEILQEREQAAAKEAAEAAAGGGGERKAKRKPLVKQAVTELLRSFGSYSQIERRYKGTQETNITREMEEAANSKAGGGSPPSPPTGAAAATRISSLLDRGMARLVKRNYDAAREDILEAGELLSALVDSDTTPEGAGVSPEVEAAVWEWQGTFLQLSGELDEAKKAYERCGKAMESRGEPCPADCLIKMAWVCMEKEDTEAAKALFARAMESHPDYGTSFAHRARLDAEKDGADAVKAFLEKAIELNRSDVFAWEQLGRVYIEANDIAKATATIDEGLKAAPKSDALLTLKAELKYSMAMKAGDASSCMEILELFNAAISANPTSPVLYINKASFLLQMMSDVGGAMEMLEKGVSVDSTSVNALVQLANLKIMVAREIADAEAAKAMIDKAVDLCTTKEELLETLSVRVATEGRIRGALLLGRSTLG